MPVIESAFQPPWWLRAAHVQTILPAVLRRRFRQEWQRERLELADGDFLDLDWLRTGNARLAILSHGLEGCSRNDYILGTADALRAAGWDVLAWNFRGCSGELNRLPQFYHSGATADLAAVIAHAVRRHATLALIGYSLGGNLTLKYLGEAPAHPAVRAGVAISVPCDLAASARALDRQPGNRLYLARFMATLTAKIEAKATRFPEALDATGIHAVRTFAEFDDRYTARLHGFRDAEDYWTRSSARHYLHGIGVPTLLLSARDDPFLTPASFPFDVAAAHRHLTLEAPAHGGHCGFLDLRHGLQRWSEKRVVEFLGRAVPDSRA